MVVRRTREKRINGCKTANKHQVSAPSHLLCWIVIDPKHQVVEPKGKMSREKKRERNRKWEKRETGIPTQAGKKGGK